MENETKNNLQLKTSDNSEAEMVHFSGKISKEMKERFKSWRISKGFTTDGEGYRMMFAEKFGEVEVSAAI